MSRKLKNIIMISILVLLTITSVYTGYHAKTNANEMGQKGNNISSLEPPSGNIDNNMIDVPDKPDGDMAAMPDGDMSNIPDKPDGDMAAMPDGDISNIPDKPEGDMSNIPDKPTGDSSSDDISQMPDNDMQQPQNSMGNNNEMNLQRPGGFQLSMIYYVLFVIQSLVISVILIYLILSKFNKKTVKETFDSSKTIIIYVLCTALLTGSMSFGEIFITKKIMTPSMNQNQGGLANMNTSITYSSVNDIKESQQITSGEYSSTKADENVFMVNGDIDVTLENITIKKTGDSDGGDNTSFYGTNSAVIASNGANLLLKNINVTTDATGANGVFSYGGSATTNNTSSDGTQITISDSSITTTKDNSGGIMVTGGGNMIASNLIINTSGVSSAAIRSDRGGGTMSVDGGNYTTNGAGSPAIYSTAQIVVNNATLTSNKAEGIVIEGKNSVEINNCDLIDNNTQLNGLSTTYKNIFLYQSMSGDAANGNAQFIANNSRITTNHGDTFYITNTSATITLENNTFINNDQNGHFLRIQADSWGNSGTNGGNVALTLTSQKANGSIVVDSISTLDMTLKNNSYYEGQMNKDNSAKSLTLTLDETSKIKLTGDCYVTSFTNAIKDNSNIDFNGYKLYVNNIAI